MKGAIINGVLLAAVSSDAAARKEIQILPIGDYVDQEGRRFAVSADDVRYMARWKAGISRDLVIDYNHQTIKASVEGGEAPAAGWIKRLIDRGADGLWAEVEWTDSAREAILAGKYKYISGYIQWNRLDENGVRQRIVCDHAALTNWPWMQEVHAVAAGAAPGDEDKPKIETEGGERMQKLIEWLKKWLAIEGEVTDDEFADKALAALEKLTGAAEKVEQAEAAADTAGGVLDAVRKALDLKDEAGEAEITGRIVSLTAQGGAKEDVEKKLAKIELELAEKKRDDLVAAALTAGKLPPALKPWAEESALKDPEGFARWAKDAPVVVSLGATTKPAPDASDTDDEHMQRSCKIAGITPETYKKYNPAE